jgi:SAM-dependent methyltransferase
MGCGAGRHLLELARRGHEVTGFDVRPEMVAFVKEQTQKANVSVTVSQGDLREITVRGTFDLATCLMDTFRFLLTNEEIIRHLRQVSERLSAGGLYVTDFWIPLRWDQMANEIYQWEQTEGQTRVRVFYLQHPDSIDPVSQTFEDELVFVVEDAGQSQEIRGGRTRTRLIMPQEFRALVEASGEFDVVGTFADFDLEKPLDQSSSSWRMVTVLKKRVIG